jgi:hypothetical protein
MRNHGEGCLEWCTVSLCPVFITITNVVRYVLIAIEGVLRSGAVQRAEFAGKV